MPSGINILEKSHQVDRVRVYKIASADVQIVLFPELIVKFKAGTSDEKARRLLRLYGAQHADQTFIPERYIVTMPNVGSVVNATNNMARYVPAVEYAEPNFYYVQPADVEAPQPGTVSPASAGPAGEIADPWFPEQWSLGSDPVDFGIQRVWKEFQTRGENIKIAIIDDGVDLNHEDLKAAIVGYWDTTKNTNVTEQLPYTLQPEAIHGTLCAGIIASQVNGKGTVGVAPGAKLIAIKAATYTTSNGRPVWSRNPAALAAAIEKARLMNADIISASWGIPGGLSEDIQQAILRASGNGGKDVVMVFAAGNLREGMTPEKYDIEFPAILSSSPDARLKAAGLISVAACTPCDSIKAFQSCDNDSRWASKYAPDVTVVAPGTGMVSTLPNNQYTSQFWGTSAATPFVAGVIALMLSKEPGLKAQDVVKRLMTSSKAIAGPSPGSQQLRRINAFCALRGATDCQ